MLNKKYALIFNDIQIWDFKTGQKMGPKFSSWVKGILIPRMTQTQIEAITSPANGLTVYNENFTIEKNSKITLEDTYSGYYLTQSKATSTIVVKDGSDTFGANNLVTIEMYGSYESWEGYYYKSGQIYLDGSQLNTR